jgi:hypothetical protein
MVPWFFEVQRYVYSLSRNLHMRMIANILQFVCVVAIKALDQKLWHCGSQDVMS